MAKTTAGFIDTNFYTDSTLPINITAKANKKINQCNYEEKLVN